MEGKGNDGKGNIPERDIWETPQEFWNTLNKQFDFKFDCCANEKNTKTKEFSDYFESLDVVENMAWMNPPFSNSTKMFEHFFKVVKKGVAIFRCDNFETKIWQKIILPNMSWVFIPEGRVSYRMLNTELRGGNGTRFPSALIGLNVEEPKGLKGTCLVCKR
jgi:hypothetical protein